MIPETRSTSEILIVGGGPAGGLAAWLFAKAGRTVTLIEAQAVLDHRVCGAYLCPAGVALLDELGLREQLTANMRPLLGMVLVSPRGNRLQTRFPANTRLPDYGLSLLRPDFDNALLDLAAKAGASVLRGKRLNALAQTKQGWRAQLADGELISTRLIIGADGRKSRVAQLLNLAADPWQKRVAVHIDVPTLVPTEPYGEMHVFPDGSYLGLNPIRSTTLNISALCEPKALRQTGAAAFINQRIQSSEHLRYRIAPLNAHADLRATFPAAATARDVIARNAALIGDASGFIDPLTGEGIYQALWTAQALAEEVSCSWTNDVALNAALRHYAKRRRRQYRGKRWCAQLFQGIIRRPQISNTVLNALALRAEVGNAFIGLIGNIYSPGEACWHMMRALA